MSPILDPLAWEAGHIHLQWDHLYAQLRRVISQVLELEGLSLVLIAPLWPQKEWFADLLALLVVEPLELPRVWNLLVQPHVRKYYRGLETFRLHTWNLSSDLSEKQVFREVLCISQQLISGAPQLPFNSPNGPGFLIGVIDGVSIQASHLSLR